MPNPSRAHYQLLIDGKPGPVSHGFLEPLFSPDGERHAYLQTVFPLTAARPSYELVVDGKVAPYNAGDPQFTTDGLHLFTKRAVPMGSIVEVLVDGKPFMRIPDGVQWHMAPTGSAVLGVASVAQGATRTFFLLAGNRKVPGSECSDGAGLSGVYMSSDAKHFAAKCKTWIVADGKKGQEYAGVTNVAFTADGRAVYQAMTNGKSFVIVGDQESDAYDFILPETAKTRADQTTQNFAPPPAVIRGNKVGYIARALRTGNDFVVVVDGKKIPAPFASTLSLSPDGSRFAFLSGNGYQNMTVDGTAYPQWTVGKTLPGFQSPFQWSADSKHIAWLTAAPNVGVAIDGKFIAAAGMSVFVRFTADSKHLVSMSWAPGPRTLISVDGEQVLDLPPNLELVNQADIYWSFPEDGTVIFVAQDGDQMKRFKITPGTETSVETVLAKAK